MNKMFLCGLIGAPTCEQRKRVPTYCTEENRMVDLFVCMHPISASPETVANPLLSACPYSEKVYVGESAALRIPCAHPDCGYKNPGSGLCDYDKNCKERV
ncbi:MAG: hypothetical protein UX91_C0015G0010 [Candidatus Amesbacteria bacterium GW2011_GWB1_47_19]|nr:MAG: hypothetical protein UX91_C0015G0010 [Candidatus Amesbacteria bacterium GW2011_GWB1_47_19]